MGVNRIGNREAVVDSFLPSPTVTVSRRRRSHSLTPGWLAGSLTCSLETACWRLEIGGSFVQSLSLSLSLRCRRGVSF